ncbi:MAG: hypothetical protein GY841_13715 [FCB group bacterium]|nr:hypothetical protein [FCB group bacterium]
MDRAKTHIGEFFVISFPEAIPSDETLYLIQDMKIGGLILFADHCRDQFSLKSWLKDLKKSLNYNLIVAVDQEGGRVRRFQLGFPMLEAPRFYAYHNKLPQYCSDLGRVCERLFETGVNFNLVPSVDLMDFEEGHVLDSRTFSDQPELTTAFAKAAIEIHHAHGLSCCAKHFPGLGRSSGDPHQVLSVSDLTEAEFFEQEILPFQAAIADGVDGVMVTHLSAPRVDERPAIVSAMMIQGWLKDRLEFEGPVVTDDLLMEGARQAASSGAAVESFEAGSDLLIFGQDIERTRAELELFERAWSDGRFDNDRQKDALRRGRAFRQKIQSP